MKPKGNEQLNCENLEALVRKPINIFALTIPVAITAITLNVWPLIAGIVLELLYIAIMLAFRFPSNRVIESNQDSCTENLSIPTSPNTINPAGSWEVSIPRINGNTVLSDNQTVICATELTDNESYRTDLHNAYHDGVNIDSLDPVYQHILLRLEGDVPNKLELTYQIDSLFAQYRHLYETKVKLQKHLINLLDDSLTPDNLFSNPTLDINLGMPSVIYRNLVDRVEIDGTEKYEEWIKKIVIQIHEGYEARLRELSLLHNSADFSNIDIGSLTKILIKRNRLADKISNVLINIHFELLLISNRFGQMDKEINVRKHDHILNDLKALTIQLRSLLRSIDDLELLIASINQDRDMPNYQSV